MQAATTALLVFGALLGSASAEASGDRTISKVVKLLQGMLDTSKDDAATDNLMYNKYKCFADISDAAKTASIKKKTEEIDILESQLEQFTAENGQLSDQVATLNKDIAANQAATTQATNVRKSSNEAFVAMEADLTTGIGQMSEALVVLKAIALAQTQTSFLQDKQVLSSKARDALIAVSALLPSESQKSLQSFLQAKSSKHANAIVRILEALKTTFEANLASARETEAADVKAFDATVALFSSSSKTMRAALGKKSQKVGDNDGKLSSVKTSYDDAVGQKQDEEEALETLRTEATTKDNNFEQRKMLRANEDAALSQAISILDSDEAFSGFAETKATSEGGLTGSFLQVSQEDGKARFKAVRVLEEGLSQRLANLAGEMRAGNPFAKVVSEINEMKQVIITESTADTEKKSWCEKENKNSAADSKAKGAAILELKGSIDGLTTEIGSDDAPKTGLMLQINEARTNLGQNQQDQARATKLRKEENAIYLADMKNFNYAKDLLARSIQVLTKYYKTLDEKYLKKEGAPSLVQKKASQDPADPDAAGTSTLGAHNTAGTSAIQMLEFILGETEKERAGAQKVEDGAKKDYDTEIEKLKGSETTLGKSIIDLTGSLADNEKNFQEKTSDLKDTTMAKNAIDDYLLKIKPGCDFITDNFDAREQKRGTETTALNQAVKLIEGSPLYKAAAPAAK